MEQRGFYLSGHLQVLGRDQQMSSMLRSAGGTHATRSLWKANQELRQSALFLSICQKSVVLPGSKEVDI